MTYDLSPDDYRKHVIPTLEMHAASVRDAEDALDRARKGLLFWIEEAYRRGMSIPEIADATREAEDDIEFVVRGVKRA